MVLGQASLFSRSLRSVRVIFRRRVTCSLGVIGLLLFGAAAPDALSQARNQAREGAAPSIEEEQYDILRRLLGVSPPTTMPEAAQERAPADAVTTPPPQPQAVESAEAAPAEPPAVQAEAPRAAPVAPTKAAKSTARPKPQPAPKKAAAPKPAPKAASEPAVVERAAPAAQGQAGARASSLTPQAAQAQKTALDAPAPGTVLTAPDVERWKSVMGPSIQWALRRGAALTVVAPKAIPVEAARALATERYHERVELKADKTDMKNYVAGIPFPEVGPSDPDAGLKVMLNQQARISTDDVDVRGMACESARILEDRGLAIEKRYVTEHWRRLAYVGRLYYEPKPTWSTIDGVRYRESQYPFIEPVDLKGGGWSSTRFLDPGRLDDVWLYNPTVGRVRRMNTPQRSQGMFGQDMDIDSLWGFAANPAWTQWHFLGMKTILAPMHASRMPVEWNKPPADFLFNEGWEPREVYVIVGRSRIADYGSADRVIYVDRESSLTAYSEIYDLKGQLWRALVPAWSFGSKARPELSSIPVEETLLPGYTMIDLEINHVTRCELPARGATGDMGWYYNYGTAGGVTPGSFDASNLGGSQR